MRVLILLGAGASYGSGDCNPTPPPLGTGLFTELCALGGVASSVASPLREVFLKDFELGMARFREDNNQTVALLREITGYFVRFTLGRNNVYRQLISAIQRSPHTVTLVTTNYDMLIDEAISTSGSHISYLTPNQPNGSITLLKIHGSVNFVPALGGVTITGMNYGGQSSNTMISSPTRILSNDTEILEFMVMQPSVAPSIAVYAPGKPVPFAPRFITQVQDDWRRTVENADEIFVIGLRVLPADGHIWDSLANTTGILSYVGGEPGVFRDWAKRVGRMNAALIGPTKFAEAMPIIQVRLTT